MRGIEALVKPGTQIRLVFDHHIPCIAQVIGQREEGRGGLTRVTRTSRGLRLGCQHRAV